MPVSLHTHSWYSLLEGVSSPEALLGRAAAAGYTSLALTDTNNLYGAVAFVEQAARHGLRPLLGACLRQGRARCVALIADRAGYRNLCRVISRLHLAAAEKGTFFFSSEEKKNVPFSDLAECAEGLHVLVDDVGLAERLREAFGRRLWLEVIRPRCRRREGHLLEGGRPLGLKPVASTAAHFATAADYPTFRLATAVRQNTLLDRLPTALAVAPAHSLVTADEMARRFADLPEAVRHGDELAELLRSDVLPRD